MLKTLENHINGFPRFLLSVSLQVLRHINLFNADYWRDKCKCIYY